MSMCQDSGRAVGGIDSNDLSMPRCLLECVFSFFPSDKFTRFCQWKNVELNIHVSGSGSWRARGPWGNAVARVLPSAPQWWLLGEDSQCWDPSRKGWRKVSVCPDHRSRRPWYQGLSLLPRCLCCGAEEACSDPGCCHSAADHE